MSRPSPRHWSLHAAGSSDEAAPMAVRVMWVVESRRCASQGLVPGDSSGPYHAYLRGERQQLQVELGVIRITTWNDNHHNDSDRPRLQYQAAPICRMGPMGPLSNTRLTLSCAQGSASSNLCGVLNRNSKLADRQTQALMLQYLPRPLSPHFRHRLQ